jgi:hypothetical protein
MNAKRLAFAVALVAASFASAAKPSAAATCGEVDPATNKTAKAVLALDEEKAVTPAHFGRKTGRRTLSLIFTVTGCELPNPLEPAPTLGMLPVKNVDELPAEAISLRETYSEDSTFYFILSVESSKFDPGLYGSLISARAPYLSVNATPVSVSRSEDREWIPGLLGAAAGIVGFLWFLILKLAARTKLAISWYWLIPIGVAATIAGALAGTTSYFDQDVWALGENWKAALVGGFTGATTGTMVGVLAIVFGSAKAA